VLNIIRPLRLGTEGLQKHFALPRKQRRGGRGRDRLKLDTAPLLSPGSRAPLLRWSRKEPPGFPAEVWDAAEPWTAPRECWQLASLLQKAGLLMRCALDSNRPAQKDPPTIPV
jgi:hypothetical protein